MSLTEIAQVIIAAAVVVLTAAGVLGILSGWFRRVVVARIVRSIWRMAVSEDQTSERLRVSQAAKRERLRSAVGVLAEGLAMSLTSYDSSIKIAQAVAELRTEGPAELEPHLGEIVTFVERSLDMRGGAVTPGDVDRLMRPVTEIVGTELNRPDH
jgi:hypothetical protein